jgi:hypothetical protein
VARQELDELLFLVLPLEDRVADIGPVEARRKHPCVVEPEPLDDVFARHRVGGGGQRDARHTGIEFGDPREVAVLGPEVMAPLADAMRLVDRKERNLDAREHLLEARHHQPLGRHVNEVEFTAQQLPAHRGRILGAERRVERGSPHAGLLQRLDLVVHQRDQRRNDDTHPRPADRRDLVAGRFSRAGRKQHHRVAALGDVADHRLLLAAEARVPEHLVQHVGRIACRERQARLCQCPRGAHRASWIMAAPRAARGSADR